MIVMTMIAKLTKIITVTYFNTYSDGRNYNNDVSENIYVNENARKIITAITNKRDNGNKDYSNK